MLNPNSRALYTDMLTAPVGMVFDEAVAATFSMDPMVLLEAPVHLALQGAGGKEPPDPLAILDSVRRFSRKITVCVQNGQILVPSSAKPNPLFGLLEEMCVEMVVPKGGVFHPKLWCIRFQDVHSDAAWMRLVILSRNMTLDRSWDLSLQLDGPVGKRNQDVNRPLARFFNRVQRMTKRPLVEERAEQLHGLFMQGMNGEHALQVDLKDVEDVDLSFFQIVSAAYKSLPKGRLRFVQVPSHIADKAEQAGFIPRHGGDVFLERSV